MRIWLSFGKISLIIRVNEAYKNEEKGECRRRNEPPPVIDSRMNKKNYQREMEQIIKKEQEQGHVPTLLLHSCCAPCSSYVLEALAEYFQITVFYYNPNIFPAEEFEKRIREQERLIEQMPARYPISFLAGNYDSEKFYEMAKGLEEVPEGGERCFRCYELRLREAAGKAKRGGYDYFTTTLSISPLKNAQKLNEIGKSLEEEYGVRYLLSDFKKKNGYKRSTELSAKYGLYRQDYCGCIYSKLERKREKAAKEEVETDGTYTGRICK